MFTGTEFIKKNCGDWLPTSKEILSRYDLEEDDDDDNDDSEEISNDDNDSDNDYIA